MKRNNQQSLAEVLGQVVDAGGMRQKMDELDIATAWDAIVGGMIAKHTVSLRLSRGVLRVKVDSAPLRHELTYQREGLVKLVNEKLGRNILSSITIE